MTKAISKPALTVFEQIKQIGDEGIEFWSARDLSKVLEYSEYRNFKPVINKAKEACINSWQNVNYHFEDVLDNRPGKGRKTGSRKRKALPTSR